jgi:type I restriction enzyme, S subunit
MANEWRTAVLGDLTVNHDGKRKPVKESERRPGPYPYYGASGIVDYVEGYLFDGDYLLIAEDGENLRTRQTPVAFMARGKSWVNNHAHIVTGNDKADTRFLMYAIAGTDISGYLTGAVMPKLTQGNLNKIELDCPPLPEQRAIAHILGTLDDKIELNRKQNETLEAMARTLFKAWFVDFEPVRAKIDGRWQRGQSLPGLPAHLYDLFPDRLVESELGEIPEGWRVEMLSKFTNIKNGFAFKSSDWTESGVPVVKIGSVKPSFVDLNQVSFVSELLAEQKIGYRLPVGSILVGLTGYVGETGFIPPTENPPLLNQRVGKFEPKEELTAFVFACVRMPEFKVFCESKAHGSAQANISTTDLLRYPVTSPGIQVLRCFCKIAQQLFDEMLGNQGQRTTLAQLRDTLLPKLISGELRVPDAERLLGEVAQA